MEWGADGARGAWIAPRLSGWGVVGSVAPRGYEAYARILHPAFADSATGSTAGSTIASHHWPWSEVARRTGSVMHPLVQFERICGGDTHAVFDDGRRVTQLDAGRLRPCLLAALVRVLEPRTSTPDDVTIGVWVGWGTLGALGSTTLRLPGRDYDLGSTTLDELADPAWPRGAGLGWTDSYDGPMPQLIWPADAAWFVSSEIDWDSTIVGGSRDLVDAVLALDSLEAYEVGEDADLSSRGDTINQPAPDAIR